MIRIDISNYLYILMMLFMFACGTAFGQTFATNESFKDNIAKDITGRSTLTYETAYKVAEQLDDLRKSDSKLAGKFNKEMPSEPKEIAKIKGPKYFYTNEGDLKVVKDGTIYSLKEWQSQKEV